MASFKVVRSFVARLIGNDTDEFFFLKKRLTEVNHDIDVLKTSIVEEIPFPPGIDAQQLLCEHYFTRRELRRFIGEEKKRILLIRLAFARALRQISNLDALEHVVFRNKACRQRSAFVNKILTSVREFYLRKIQEDSKIALFERSQRAAFKKQIHFGGYQCLPVDDDVAQVECESEPEVDSSGTEHVNIQNRPRQRFYDYSNLISTQQRLTRRVQIPIVRNRGLILRIRKVIAALRAQNKSYIKTYYTRLFNLGQLRQETIPMLPIIENQMDKEGDPHGECNDLSLDQKSNVILTSHTTDESIAKPITIPKDNWQRMCTSEPNQEYGALMTRWQKFKTVKWSRDDANGTVIKAASSILPVDFIKQNQEAPSCVLFKQYAYFRSDMEIKIILNSNKFHCGALQASFYYGGTLDKYYKDRENIACASQMTHCIIDAASSTDGILVIPYRFYKPLMGTTVRPDDTDILDMGVFRLMVLNQLKTPVDDNNIIDVTVYFRFVQPSFHGMKPRRLGKLTNQMFGSSSMIQMVKDTANLVNQIFPDPQRDNPSDVIPPKAVVPWSAHSWCVGDVCPEPINPLRLQAVGNTPHPPGTLPLEPEMQISYVSSVFGLIAQVSWSSDQEQGALLKSFPFSPVLPFGSYMQVNCKNGSENEVACSVLPPVSVMAELFAYWRGSIEYKFDFIATQFHTGRLIIAYVPRIVGEAADVTLEDLTHCDNIIVDLREERQVNYICNFLSDKPWWPRRGMNDTSSEMYPPGNIHIRVLNQLTATAAVAKQVEFNVYMRAGRDFELHVPIAPNIGLSFNTKMVEPKINVYTTLESYGPPLEDIYIGGWHSVNPSGRTSAVFRYGAGSDHVTQFQAKFGPSTPLGKMFELATDTFIHVNTLPFPYLVPFQLKGDDHMYGAAFSDKTGASVMASYLVKNKFIDPNVPAALMVFQSISSDGDWLDKSQRIYWKEVNISDPSIIIGQEAGDERKSACGDQVQLNGSLSSTWNGMLTFGEQISDLKQLLRRYQPYCQYVGSKSVDYSPAEADFAIPLMPQGLDLVPINIKKSENEYQNKMRDGPIPIIASGFRFYRGSIRLRLIVVGAQEGAFWLQHRPEYRLTNTKVFIPSKDGSERLYQHGYASLIQMSKMNNVIECEIPFYLPGQFGLLQRPRLEKIGDAVHFSMGTLYCGYDSVKGSTTKEVPYVVQGYYSMGDDMSFSVFQGFPPMLDLSLYKRPRAEGPVSWLSAKMYSMVKEDLTTEAKLLMAQAPSNLPNIPDSNSSIVDSFNSLIYKHMGDLSVTQRNFIATAFSQIVHCVISPNVKTMAWALVSIFIQLGVLSINYLSALVSSLGDVIERLFSRAKKPDSAPTIQPEGPGDDTDVTAAYCSTVITSILALIGCEKKVPKDIPSFANVLYGGMNKFTFNANGLFRFMQNNLLMFRKMWAWLVSFFYSEAALYAEIQDGDQHLLNFVAGVQWCLDARNEKAVRNDMAKTTEVYQLANTALCYLAKKATASLTRATPNFDYYCREIIKLRDELTRDMKSPPIRFEPYVICFEGKSNLGKSHLVQNITRKMLHSINYKTYDETVYTRTPGNAYWNGLANQPICLFDDFLNIEHTNQAHLQLGELFCLKSKAVFNPPMAAIEEKKIRYNPLIVAMCCNKAFSKIDGMANEEAWMRRRDIMVRVEQVDKYKGVHPRDLPDDVKANYGHLKFGIYKDTSGGDRTVPVCDLTYEQLYERLSVGFINYFNEECIQYDKSMTELKKFYPNAVISVEESCKKIEEFVKKQYVDISGEDIVVNYKKAFHEMSGQHSFTTFVQTNVEIAKSSQLLKDQAEVSSGLSVLCPSVEQNCGLDFDCPRRSKNLSPSLLCSKIFIRNTKMEKRKMAEDRILEVGDRLSLREHCFNPENLGLSFDNQKTLRNRELEAIGEGIVEGANRRKYAAMKLAEGRNEIKTSSYALPGNVLCNCNKIIPSRISSIEWRPESNVYAVAWYGDSVFDLRTVEYEPENCIIKATRNACMFISAERMKGMFPSLILSIGSMHKDNWPEHLTDDDGMNCFYNMATAKEVYDEITDRSLYRRCLDLIPSWWTLFTTLIKASALCSAVVYAFEGISGLSKLIVKSEIPQRLAEATNYSTRVPSVKLGKVIDPKTISQAAEAMDNVVRSVINRNTFFINIEYGEKTRAFRCVGLLKHYFIVLDHYVYFINSLDSFKAYYVQGTARMEIDGSIFKSRYCKVLAGSAVVICTLPKYLPQFRNLVKFIARGAQVRNHPPSARLYEKQFDPSTGQFSMVISEFPSVRLSKSIIVENDDSSSTKVDNVYSYSRSGRGVCGSLLVTTMNTNSPICGIHVAGLTDGREGYAEVLTFETFEPLLSMDDGCVVATENGGVELSFRKPIKQLQGNVIDEGTLPDSKGEVFYPPKHSRLINTVCAGVFNPITYEKPVLSSSDPRIVDAPFSPLVEGCLHHANPCLPFPEQLEIRACADVENMILSNVKPQRVDIGKLTVEQAVCGIRGNPIYEPMVMATSEGYPWIKRRPRGASSKEWMFSRTLHEDGWALDGIDCELAKTMERQDDERRRGIYQFTLFTDCLKDAKLPSEKVLIPGKTRIFSISPVDFTIQQRQYSYDFVVAYQQARLKAEHAVGIDIYGLEADVMVRWMLERGNNMVCGDYSKFGDQLYVNLVRFVYRLIALWYERNGCEDSCHAKVLECLGEEVAHARHIMINHVYTCFGGMPSGNPLTVIINSIVNSIYIRIVWQDIMMNVSLRFLDMDTFHKNVRLLTFGDDIWMVVSDDFIGYFNACTISECFAKYNIKFTNSTKGDKMIPFSRLSDPDTTFLKCTFARHEYRNIYKAQLERRVVEETCNWTWNTQPNLLEASVQACKEMMELSFGHGKQYYEERRSEVMRYWQDNNVQITIPDWNAVDMRIYDGI